ncbi:MAG: DNA methyltransferase [Methylovulum sp.]|nr:DNA methyltransferase [Methylovulum sp.]
MAARSLLAGSRLINNGGHMVEFIDQIIHGDCLEVMGRLPNECIDMIFTDPPYGHGNHNGDWNARLNAHRGIENKPIANDDQESMRRVVSGMLERAARLLKHDCCCCCCCCCCGGGGPRPTFAWLAQRMDENGLQFFHSVIWDKGNPGLGWRYRRQHEMIMVAHRTGGRLRWADDNVTQRNVICAAAPRERVHPNEKPLELVQRFIALHTLPGDTVLDPFAGSSTTAIACAKLGRRFICIEKDAQYVAVGKRRLEEFAAQGNLFKPGAQNTMEAGETAYNSASTQPEQLSLDGVL